MGNPRSRLADALCAISKRTQSSFHSGTGTSAYLPEATVRNLVTEENIIRELALDTVAPEDLGEYLKQDFIKYIREEAWKTFLIVLFAHRISVPRQSRRTLIEWRKKGHTDAKLPIDTSTCDDPFLVEEQWKFLSPIFRPDKYLYELEDNHILPIKKLGGPITKGGFGSVFRAEVHPDHTMHFGIREV